MDEEETAQPLKDWEELGDLRACLLDFTPVGVDLGANGQAKRFEPLLAALIRGFRRLVAEPDRRVPGTGVRFDLRQLKQSPADFGVLPLDRLGDQLSPHATCLVTAIGSTKLKRERVARTVTGRRLAVGSTGDLDRRFEQIPPDAGGAEERRDRDGYSAVGQDIGIVQLLRERQSLLRVA